MVTRRCTPPSEPCSTVVWGGFLYCNAHVSPPARHKKEKKKDKERDRERRSDKDRIREERERSASRKKKSKDKEWEQRERKSDGEKGDVKVGVTSCKLFAFSLFSTPCINALFPPKVADHKKL